MLEFRPAQARVITLSQGRHACLAPAGSGKTEILTERIYNALAQGIAAQEMLCLTFTNRAGLNMRDKVQARLGEVPKHLFIGNLHSYCFTQQSNKQSICLMTQSLEQKLLQQSMQQLEYLLSQSFAYIQDELLHCYRQFNLNTAPIFSFDPMQITTAKHEIFARKSYHAWQIEKIRQLILPLLSPAQDLLDTKHKTYIKQQLKCLDQNIAADQLNLAFACAVYVHSQYQELKDYYQYQDYNDLLLEQLIQQANHPKQRYQWLQIDEVQDLSPLHWLLIEYLTAPNAHLLLLGDLDQSIYRFLGASVELTTQRLGNNVYHLVDNFRNPENLVALSNQYRKVHFQAENFVAAHATKAYQTDALLHLHREYDDQQYQAILELLSTASQQQKTTAILCNTNQHAEEFAQHLQRHGIAHFSVTQHDLLSGPLYLDFLAFWRCLMRDDDRAAWARMLWRFGNLTTHPPRHLAHLDAELAAIKLQHDLQHYGVYLADLQQVPHGFSSQHDVFLHLYKQQQLLFIDTETTGLNVQHDDIIQMAAFNQEQELDLYCHTHKDLSASQKIHQISQALLQEKGQNFAKQIQILLKKGEAYALIAHNLGFDDQMLIANLKRYAPEFIQDYLQRIKFCSLKLMRQLYPNLNSYTLADLLTIFQLAGTNSHNALDDVKAGFNLLPVIADKITQNQQGLASLYARSEKCLRHFNEKFSPLFKAAQQKMYLDNAFKVEDLLGLYCDYVQQHLADVYAQYQAHERKQLTLKLAKHSQLHFQNFAGLSDWQKALDFYQTAKESDLITQDDYVIVSTMHRAKGLEFEQVVLPNLVDRHFPSYPVIKKLQAPDAIHREEAQQLLREQQRLLYVALTRAKSKLIISTFRKKRSEQRFAKAHSYCMTPFLAEFQPLFKTI